MQYVVTSSSMEYVDHRKYQGKLPSGKSYEEFVRLSQIETDECVVWPYSKAGQRRYGQVYVRSKPHYAHELAIEVRLGPRPNGMIVLHGECNNPSCMNYRHLRWGTPSENNLDRRRDGTAPIGIRNPQARLNDEEVKKIRERYANGEAQRKLATEYGVGVMTINRAIRSESWRHVQ